MKSIYTLDYVPRPMTSLPEEDTKAENVSEGWIPKPPHVRKPRHLHKGKSRKDWQHTHR